MKAIYKSVYTEEELHPGIPLRTVPSLATISLSLDGNNANFELILNGKRIPADKRTISVESESELEVRRDTNTTVYTIRPLVDPLGIDYSKAYEQFSYEYNSKSADDIESIKSGRLKLYAVDQSTKVRDWTHLLQDLEDCYPFFKSICERPKSHLRSVNEVRPIETVKRIGYESIPYLAAHSEDWLARTAGGLKPARLFSRVEDDDYQIYENRVVKTLIDIIIPSLRRIESDMREKYAQLNGIINSGVQTGSFGFDVTFEKAIRELIKTDEKSDLIRSKACEDAEKFEKWANNLLKKYLSLRGSRLYRWIIKAKPVTNPLNETNILLMDKNYSEIFKLWKSLHKELAPVDTALEAKCSFEENYNSFKQFCMTLFGYAAHVLCFEGESSGHYKRYDDTVIEIKEKNGIIVVDLYDSTEHEISVPGGITLPIHSGEHYKCFRYDGKKLYWPGNISNADIEDFASLLKPKGKNEARREYNELKGLIIDREREYSESKTSRIVIVPCMVEIKGENRNSFKEFINDNFERIRQDNKADIIIAALPKCQEEEQSIVDYAFDDKDKVLLLPLSMFDINSFRRAENIIIRMILELGKETCPCCGGKMRRDDDRIICDSCRGLIVTKTICPHEDCKNEYRYISYSVSEDTINRMKAIDHNNFFQYDSLYQYKNVVKMRILNDKLVTFCPHCGR